MKQRMTFKEAENIVKQKLDIIDIIGRHVALKKSGHSHKGLCPFHHEKTPSFYVNPDKQLFKCFGCGEGGDTISFLMKFDNKTYGEIISDFAEDEGIEILRDERKVEQSDDTEILFKLHILARNFYHEQLHNSELAKAYLNKRQITPEWQESFGLGYAPSGWDNLIKYLKQQLPSIQHNPAVLERAGLVHIKNEGNGFYDRFRNRLMIPILDEKGRIVAFGARSLHSEDEPKYLNSPETPIYLKHRILYGFSQAKESIRKSRYVILMEGYFDVISAHMAGLTQSVGICGTALTEQHLKRLKQSGAETLYLCFDTDKAGQAAVLKAIELVENQLMDQEIALKVILLPGEKDPDDFLKTHGKEGFLSCLNQAEDFLSFKFDKALAQVESICSPEGRIKAVQIVTPLLSKIRQPVIRYEHARQLAERIQIPEETLFLEIKRLEKQNQTYQNKKNYEFQAIFDLQAPYIKRNHRNLSQTSKKPENIEVFRQNLSGKVSVEEKEHLLLSYLFLSEESYKLVMEALKQLNLQSDKADFLLKTIHALGEQWSTIDGLIQQLTEHFHKTQNLDQLQFLANRVMLLEEFQNSSGSLSKGLKSFADREKLNRDINEIVDKIKFLQRQASLNVLAKDVRQCEQEDNDQSALEVQLQIREQLKAHQKTGPKNSTNVFLKEEQGV